KDYRSGWYFVPKWVKDCPFEYQAGHLSKSKIGTKYKVLKTLTQRAKGGIYLVVDTEAENKNQLFIMKEARKFIGNDSFGRDARHRLRNEKYFLQKLENVKGIPKYYDYFYEEGNDYLIMSYIEGQTLRQITQEWNLE